MLREKIVFSGSTNIGQYQVIDMVYEGRDARVLFGGGHRAAQSGVARDDNADLLFDYNQRFLELANGLRPATILVVGGGAYTLPTALLWALPEAKIDVVELDGGLWDIAEAFFGAKASKRLRRITAEGGDYLLQCEQRYELIIIDAFIEASIPPELQTTEVAQALRRCLQPDGLLAINIISSWLGSNALPIQRFGKLLESVFTGLEVFPAGWGISLWQPQNFIITAGKLGVVKAAAECMRYPALAS